MPDPCAPCVERSMISAPAIEITRDDGVVMSLCETHARAWASLRPMAEEDAILAILDEPAFDEEGGEP